MKSLSIVFLALIALVAACDSDSNDVNPPDDGPVDTPPDCGIPSCFDMCVPHMPAGMQGCPTGEKCVWEILQTTPEAIGRIACVPDGTVAVGGTCTEATEGMPDDCVAGSVCAGGVCRDICGFDGSSAAECPQGGFCARYEGLFANGEDQPSAGACSPGCDPITQLQHDGNPCPTGDGCYLLSSATSSIAVCANAGTVAVGAEISGPAFANSCVPGGQPRRRDPATQIIECGGLCRPADVTSTTNMASESGVAPDSCQARWGTPPPSDGINGESCRYWWAREQVEEITPFSNTVGWCFRHAAFQYDTDGDQMDDAPFPRCIELTTGDVLPPLTNPPHNDAIYFWCAALPTMFAKRTSMTTAAPTQQITRRLISPFREAPVQLDRLRR